jgi:hypothetical protein
VKLNINNLMTDNSIINQRQAADLFGLKSRIKVMNELGGLNDEG